MEKQTYFNNTLVSEVSVEEQATFFKKTYANLAIGVLLFIVIESFFLKIPALVEFMLSMTDGYLWIVLLLGFMGVNMLSNRLAFHPSSKLIQYTGYVMYIVVEALIFIPLIYIAIFTSEGYELINQAAILTLGLFVGLSAVVLLTRINFSFLKSVLTIGFVLAIALIIAGLIFGFDLGLWFSAAMVFLASGSILYNTYTIKEKYTPEQFVPAALSLFASLMLLFWYILRILLSRN